MGSNTKRHFTDGPQCLHLAPLPAARCSRRVAKSRCATCRGRPGQPGRPAPRVSEGAAGAAGAKGAAGTAGQTIVVEKEKPVVVEKVVEKEVVVERQVVVEKVVEVQAPQFRTDHAPAKAPGPAPAPGQAQGSIRFMFRAGPEEKGFEAITKVFRGTQPEREGEHRADRGRPRVEDADPNRRRHGTRPDVDGEHRQPVRLRGLRCLAAARRLRQAGQDQYGGVVPSGCRDDARGRHPLGAAAVVAPFDHRSLLQQGQVRPGRLWSTRTRTGPRTSCSRRPSS